MKDEAKKYHYEWAVFSDYGYGYEMTEYCDGLCEAKQALKEYRDNQPEYNHVIKRTRVYNM